MQNSFTRVCPIGRINGIWHLLRRFIPGNAWTPNARTILLLFICNLREVELVHLRVWILRLERIGCRNLVNIRLFTVYKLLIFVPRMLRICRTVLHGEAHIGAIWAHHINSLEGFHSLIGPRQIVVLIGPRHEVIHLSVTLLLALEHVN